MQSEPSYPSLLKRIQSTFVDLLVVIVGSFITGYILEKTGNTDSTPRLLAAVFLFFIYEPLFTSLGGTIGNRLIDIKVRQDRNIDKKINFFSALVRYILKTSLGWISFITINMNEKKRAIHDLAAGSVVIERD